jgi:hypothetical protein
MYRTVRILSMIACLISVTGCHGGPADRLVLSDFESEADLDRMQWHCHTLFSLSASHVTHGKSSLRLELYPSAYPGMAFALPQHDWSGYAMLSLDIYNPQEEVLSLAMRIDDRKEYPEFNDRYNSSFSIHPGMNHVSIPLASITTSGTKRTINLKNIHRCLLFMAQPQKTYIVHIDYVHLT